MTATGYHCLGIFLHASDLPEEKIEKYIWRIRQILNVNL